MIISKRIKLNGCSIFVIMATVFIMAILPISIHAKSLYVNKDLNSLSPIRAYDIQPSPTYLVFQQDSSPTRYGGAGLAIDSDSEILFVTFEFSNVLDIVNAKNLSILGQVTAPNAQNLAGIVVDQENQKVYTVDRHTNHLYLYSWDAVTKTLTNDITSFPYYMSLSSTSDAYGIALDEINDILYVADGSTKQIDSYDTNTCSPLETIQLNHDVIGIAVDAKNGFLYTGAGFRNIIGLFKYDLSTKAETYNTDIGVGIMGIAVDPDTSLVYATTGFSGDNIRVFDSNLTQLCVFQ